MLPNTNLTTVSINYNNKFAEHYKLICNKLGHCSWRLLCLCVSTFCPQRKWQVKRATVYIAITTAKTATGHLRVHTKGYRGDYSWNNLHY